MQASQNDFLARKLSAVAALSEEDVTRLSRILGHERTYGPGADVLVEGEQPRSVYAVQSGWAIRYKLLPDGRRQIINFVLPGDLIGLRAIWLRGADHSVSALTELVLASIDPAEMEELRHTGRLGEALGWALANEDAIFAEHIVSLGRRTAFEKTAHLILELRRRLQYIGLTESLSYTFPLTQETLADTLGLSIVHVNRTLQRLRREGLIDLDNDHIAIRDIERLKDIAGWEETT